MVFALLHWARAAQLVRAGAQRRQFIRHFPDNPKFMEVAPPFRRNLGQLERDVPAMADHLSIDLHQFFLQRGQGPVFYFHR
jgi:hypothetical protein